MNDRDTLICALFLLVPFAVQLAILFLTANRFRFLRLAVPVLAVIAGVVFSLACILTAPSGWAILLAPLVVIICLALAGLAMVGWMLAWFVYYLTQHLTKRKASDTQWK